jgi:hypothetical protein
MQISAERQVNMVESERIQGKQVTGFAGESARRERLAPSPRRRPGPNRGA